MKVTVGMFVHGECGSGKVIAMTEQWCIYKDKNMKAGNDEIAEPWDSITIQVGPESVTSSIPEKELSDG